MVDAMVDAIAEEPRRREIVDLKRATATAAARLSSINMPSVFGMYCGCSGPRVTERGLQIDITLSVIAAHCCTRVARR